MVEKSSYEQGAFSWVDLMTHDIEKAKAFYGAFFGWEAVAFDTEGGPPYLSFQLQGKQVAGLGEMNEEMKAQGVMPLWNNYIKVDDVEAIAAQVESLGGTVTMPPMKVMEAGSMACILDPTGGGLSFWQPNKHTGAERMNEVGAFCWNELATRDIAGAQKFYTDLFGWEYEKKENSPANYFLAKNKGEYAAGLLEMDEQWEGMPPHWTVYFQVEDADASCEKAKALGGAVQVEPFDIPDIGRMAVVADDQGAVFCVIKEEACC